MNTVPCSHCGQPAPAPALGAPDAQPALSFCCTGCESVYFMLHGEGFESFYKFNGDQACAIPASSPVPADRLERLEPGLLQLWANKAKLDEQGVASLEFYLRGLHCAGCIWLIEQLPQALSGVVEARVEFGRQRLRLRWLPEQVELQEVLLWLARFGYSAHALDEAQEQGQQRRQRPLLRRMGVAWAVTGNVMLLSFAHYSGLNALNDPIFYHGSRVLSLLMTTLGLLYGADMFFKRAWGSLKLAMSSSTRAMPKLSMDVPLSLGILLGWGYSAWATITGHGEVWFDSIAMLIAALLTSRWLQASANARAADSTRQIYALLPQTARRLRADGALEIVETETLARGDLVEVRPGELIPADGTIHQGMTSLHRGALTGESRPESATVGAFVEAGVTNMDNPITIEVLNKGALTKLGQLQTWIEDHANRRAPIEQLTDRLGAFFVLAILVIASLTALAWSLYQPQSWLPPVIAVLVVSCPCALAMASPLTLSVALGRAATQGIFIKHDDVIEALDKADIIVFDKTGTLTYGDLSVIDVVGQEELLGVISALERQSTHPIGQALAKAWSPIEADELQEIEHFAGSGVSGLAKGCKICVGSPAWILGALAEQAPDNLLEAYHRFTQRGLTPVMVSADFALVAVLGLGDTIRPEAQNVLEALRERGLKPQLLSGDHAVVVDVVGQQLGFSPADVRGQVTHEQKLAQIEHLKAQGHTVIMVGDGVNDATALQAAHVGITFERGAQVSLLASDIFLRGGDLGAILTLHDGARQSMKVIRANLWSSGLYNIIAVLLAAFGLISPLTAAILMPVSSLSVVLSSILQRHFKPLAQRVHYSKARHLNADSNFESNLAEVRS